MSINLNSVLSSAIYSQVFGIVESNYPVDKISGGFSSGAGRITNGLQDTNVFGSERGATGMGGGYGLTLGSSVQGME